MISSYTITDLSQEFDITTRTIRFYEEKGLLQPRRKGNARIFSNGDRVRLKLILRGKRLGFSLEESRDIISLYEPKTSNIRQLDMLMDKIQEKREMLEHKRQEINSMLKDLKSTEEICRDSLAKLNS